MASSTSPTQPTADAKVELVARLRKQVLLRITPSEGTVTGPINPDGPEAADEIERLQAALEAPHGMTEAMIETFEWLLGIAAGVVEMGDPSYEKACVLYEQITAMQAARPIAPETSDEMLRSHFTDKHAVAPENVERIDRPSLQAGATCRDPHNDPDALRLIKARAASGMEAATAGETVKHGSTEGDSPTAESGDAHA